MLMSAFVEFVLSWYYTWEQDALTWFKRVGNFFIFCGCIGISISAEWSITIWPFVLYTIGNTIWIWLAWKVFKDKPLIEMNLFFFVFNGYAIFTRL